MARAEVYTGSGTAFFLRAGYTFALYDHPRASFDTKYLVTEVEHFGNQSARTAEMLRLTGLAGLAEDEVYRVEVTAIPATVQFRAEQRAPWPRIYGTEHGVVDGEAESEYAQLDEHGRYLVRFAFDESGLPDGKASTRVRMMQPHGGGVEGWHFPLRKGTEVLLTFLGGDPDRPVIAGVVPNALKPSPITQANQTRNVIQTGGRNRMEIEDKKGFERITWSTPYANTMIRMGAPNADHEMIVRTDGATVLETGQNWDVDVGGALWEHVTDVVNEKYDSSKTTLVGAGLQQTVIGDAQYVVTRSEVHTVLTNENHTVGVNRTMTVGGVHQQTVGGSEVHTVTGGVTQKFGNLTIDSKSYIGINAGGPVTVQAPSWDVIIPSTTETKSHSQEFLGFSFEMTGGLIETVGGHMENVGIHLETIGIHVETVGFHYAPGGAELEQRSMALKNAALNFMDGAIIKLGF